MSKFSIPDKVVYVCTGSKCGKKGGKDFYKAAKAFSKYVSDKEEIEVVRVECSDRCDFAPVCTIQPGNIWFKEYSPKKVLGTLQSMIKEENEA